MKLHYRFGEGVDFDGNVEELVAAVGQFEGLKSLAKTHTSDYVSLVREVTQLAQEHNSPEMLRHLLNTSTHLALPPAHHQTPVYPVDYNVPGYEQVQVQPPPPQQPIQQHIPQPVYQQQYYPSGPGPSGYDNRYANPQFNTVPDPIINTGGLTITTEAQQIQTGGQLVPYQVNKSVGLAQFYQNINNSIEWALLRCPRIFPIYMGMLVIVLVVGVLTSPLRKQLPLPAPSAPPATPSPSPKQNVAPAPTPTPTVPQPKGGTGTPPVEPPTL